MDNDEKDLNYFLSRFSEVADEAHKHGHSIVILIESADPIKRVSSVSKIYKGTLVTTIGLLQLGLMDLMKVKPD